jgi:hypothetical protein
MLPSRFPLVPFLAFGLAAFCLGAPTRADKRFDTNRTGSSGGSEEKGNAQVTPESTSATLPDDREVLKVVAAQEKLGLWYEARRTLAQAAKSSRDLDLLRRHAAVEDEYGERAGTAYRQLVEACEEGVPRPADYADLLERGLFVSLRDGDMKQGEWFAVHLQLAGRGEFAALFHGRSPASPDEAVVLGGTKAVFRLADAQETARRDDFLLAFSRCVDAFDPAAAAAFRDRSSDYFRRVRALKSLGIPQGDRVVIRLSAANEGSRRLTEKVLHLLGWKMRVTGGETVVEPAESSSASRGQMTAAALSIDEMGMQQALQSGRSFEIEIADDRVNVLFGEAIWRQAFYGKNVPPGGLTEAVAADPRLARVYLGLSAQDPETARQLARDFGLRTLADNYSNLLVLYSSAFSVAGGRAAVPGGVDAEPVWQELVGVPPSEPKKFFSALLRKDGGKLLAFYAGLMQLDLPRQKFFTASCLRTAKFRVLYDSLLGTQPGIQSRRQGRAILDFPARLPIRPDGRVAFPGSSKIWMAAAPESRTNRDSGGSLPDRSRITSPEVEDEILLRLARSGSGGEQVDLSQLASLLAIAWVDAHRKEPLDEASAILLAHEYARLQWAWPYLASFTGLGSEDLSALVHLERRFRDLDTLIRNDALGEWDALAKIISLLAESGNLTQEKAARLFRSLCERFLFAASPADLAAASLETIREVLNAASVESSRPDDAIRNLLLGEPERVTLHIGRETIMVGAADTRRRNYQEILNLQKVTSLQTLFALYHAARQIRLGPAAAAEWIRVLEDNIGGLQQVDFSSFPGVRDKVGDTLRSFQARAGGRAIREMKRNLST